VAYPKIVEDNGVLGIVEFILLPAAALKGRKEFRVERNDEEPLIYTDIKQVHEDYRNEIVCISFLFTPSYLSLNN
jgi:tyrosyl-tRNA synthetase